MRCHDRSVDRTLRRVSLYSRRAVLRGRSGPFGAVRVLAEERTSPVVRTTDTDGLLSCHVTWTQGALELTGAPDCPDPVPAVGEAMTYLTPVWPFAGQAWDLLGANLLVIAPTLVAVALLGWGLVQGARRTGRPTQTYRTATEIADRPADTGALGLLSLVDHAARALRWDAEPVHEPGTAGPSWRRDLRRALHAASWWPLGTTVVGVLLSWDSGWPQTAIIGILAAAGLALVWTVWRVASTFLLLHRTWSAPFASEWTFRAVRDPAGEWLLLLFLGETPHWSVMAPGRPPLAGTALVRGDLEDGGSVHLQIGDELWLPASAVLRVTEEDLPELHDMIRFQLTGDVTPAG